MDKLVSKIAALGIPGLVLVTAIGATGLAGGAAITTALAALGPGGILGGNNSDNTTIINCYNTGSLNGDYSRNSRVFCWHC